MRLGIRTRVTAAAGVAATVAFLACQLVRGSELYSGSGGEVAAAGLLPGSFPLVGKRCARIEAWER